MAIRLKEKRRFPRIKLRTPLRYQIRGRPEFDHAISDNIGLGGMSFVINRFITPLTVVMLEINILSRILRPIGKVAWSSPLPHSERYRLGVEFLELDHPQKDYLADYVTVNMQMSKPPG